MIARKRQSRVIFCDFHGIILILYEYTIHYERNEISLESYISNENKKSENSSSSEIQRPIPVERTVPGDIDELIFPDDEPHYISER